MCIILVVPPNTKLANPDILSTCWERNDDGGGVMFPSVHGEGVEIHKDMDKARFLDLVTNIHENVNKSVPMVIHFRVGTCGEHSEYNVHPFPIFKDESGKVKLAYVHNGQLFQVDRNSRESDSHRFAIAMEDMPKDFHKNEVILGLLQAFAKGDKMVFLDDDGEVVIVNEKAGYWDEGIWYSHGGYKPFKRTVIDDYDDDDERWAWAMAGGFNAGQNVSGRRNHDYSMENCWECAVYMEKSYLNAVTTNGRYAKVCRRCAADLWDKGKDLAIQNIDARKLTKEEFLRHFKKRLHDKE